MKLIAGDDQGILSPTYEQVELVLRSLGKPFAVLERSEHDFIQVLVRDDGFLLELQEGSEEHHYQCTNRDVSLKDVAAAFQAYLAGERNWQDKFEWKRIKLKARVRRVK